MTSVVKESVTLNQTPLVSVLLPVHNEPPDFIELAVSSLLNQTYDNLEVNVLNDGSDHPLTLDYLDRLAQSDPRIRLYHELKRGLTKTLNIGLRRCNGELIARHDADDWSDPDRIKMQVQFLARNPEVGMVGSNAMWHQENGRPLWSTRLPRDCSEILRALEKQNCFVHGAVCFRKQQVIDLGGYTETLSCAQDYDLFWRFCRRYGCSNLTEVLYHVRFRTSSVSIEKLYEQERNAELVRIFDRQRMESGEEDLQLANHQLRMEFPQADSPRWLLREAELRTLAGKPRTGLSMFLKALRMQPFNMYSYLRLARIMLFMCAPPLGILAFKYGEEIRRLIPLWLKED